MKTASKKAQTVCLGWGSLIWDSDDLPVCGEWHEDGPLVRVEFVRQSDNGRLTLAIYPDAAEIRSLWVFMDSSNLDEAVEALRKRENTGGKFIDRWSVNAPDPCEIPGLSEWASGKDIKHVIWTALLPKFMCDDNRAPSPDEAVCYLKSLEGEVKDRAEKYIRRAPTQIDTNYRRRFEAEFGWTPLP